MIVSTFASIALTIERPTSSLMRRKPYGSSQFLISGIILKKVIGHAIYQLIVLFVLLFFGDKFFNIESALSAPQPELTQHLTIMFNTYAFMSIFNIFNSRSIHREKHCFGGLSRNPLFFGLLLIVFIIHILITQFVGSLLDMTELHLQQWLWCIAFGVGVLLWGQIITIISNSICCDKKVESNITKV